MKIGFVGLGKMGKAMVLRLLEQGVDVVVFNRSPEKTEELKSEIRNPKSEINSKSKIQNDGKLYKTFELGQLVQLLEEPRVIWLMVPEGKPVDEMIERLVSQKVSGHTRSGRTHSPGVEDAVGGLLSSGDIIIDGGNSFYKDSIRRFNFLKKKGIHFLDIGTSGGLTGARNGACVMVGGEEKIFQKVKPILDKIAIPRGLSYFGPAGAGHFVKMVHNGIEYGMLQAIGEGFEMLEKGPYKLDLHKIALNYTKGSVVRGWLMELLERALKSDPELSNIEGIIGGGTTGEWTVNTARELKVSVPVLQKSLEERKKSFAKPTFSGKVIAALRYQFGGHEITKKSK